MRRMSFSNYISVFRSEAIGLSFDDLTEQLHGCVQPTPRRPIVR